MHLGELASGEVRRIALQHQTEGINDYAGHRAAPDQLENRGDRIRGLGQARRLIVVSGQGATLACKPQHGMGGVAGRLPRRQEQANGRPDQCHRQDELEPPAEDR